MSPPRHRPCISAHGAYRRLSAASCPRGTAAAAGSNDRTAALVDLPVDKEEEEGAADNAAEAEVARTAATTEWAWPPQAPAASGGRPHG